jgi:8-oxo-dGTP diphosphatase
MPSDIHDFKNAASTASLIVPAFYGGINDSELGIYLVQRKHEPYKGMWALPGGFLNCDKESLETAAVRELLEETSINAAVEDLELLCVNSDPKRDPRGHVIDHVYVVKKYSGVPKAGDDAAILKSFSLERPLPSLAFDHEKVIKMYLDWRRRYGQ